MFGLLARGRQPDPAAREILATAILSAVRGGQTLDESLGLAGIGTRSVRRQLLMVRRDLFLADALEAVALDDRVSDWSRCQRLAPLVRDFMAYDWPTARFAAPCADWPGWRIDLYKAAQTGLDLPLSPQGLLAALHRTRRLHASSPNAVVLSFYL